MYIDLKYEWFWCDVVSGRKPPDGKVLFWGSAKNHDHITATSNNRVVYPSINFFGHGIMNFGCPTANGCAVLCYPFFWAGNAISPDANCTCSCLMVFHNPLGWFFPSYILPLGSCTCAPPTNSDWSTRNKRINPLSPRKSGNDTKWFGYGVSTGWHKGNAAAATRQFFGDYMASRLGPWLAVGALSPRQVGVAPQKRKKVLNPCRFRWFMKISLYK